jgi:hypothetical protein
VFDQGIINLSVNETAATLLNADYGQHWIIIYPDLTTLREFYTIYTKRQVEENNGCLLIAPYYETTNDVRQTLSKDGLYLSMSKNEKENMLSIMDSLRLNFGKENTLNFAERIAGYIQSIGKDGITVLNDLGSFINNSKYDELLDYELMLPKEYEHSIKGMCIYHEKDFDRLSIGQKQKLIEHHSNVIRLQR